jgi:hypothetical protein
MAGCLDYGDEPFGSIKCGELISLGRAGFSGRTLLHGVS